MESVCRILWYVGAAVLEVVGEEDGVAVGHELARRADILAKTLERVQGVTLALEGHNVGVSGVAVDEDGCVPAAVHVRNDAVGLGGVLDEVERDLAQDGVGLWARRLVLI